MYYYISIPAYRRTSHAVQMRKKCPLPAHMGTEEDVAGLAVNLTSLQVLLAQRNQLAGDVAADAAAVAG